MTSRTAALRYARALLDVVVKENQNREVGAPDVNRALQEIEEQLSSFAGLLKQHATLEKVLLNPAVPVARKHATVAELLTLMTLSGPLGKLLLLLADRDRLVLLPDLVAAYRQRVLDHQHVVRAEVTTTAPMSADRARAIERSLAKATSRTVILAAHVDPALIGGVVTRIGGTIRLTQPRRPSCRG